MLIDRTQRKWAWISLLILAVSTVSYVIYARTAPNGPHGGSVMGLLFGIVGTAFMVFAGLLAARKRVPHWRLGSAQFWLRGHIWLGTLSMPLILFHAGFGWGGLVENLLWILFGVVYVSGFYGLFVQNVLPRFLTTRIPLETFPAQIPYQCQRMQFLADRLVSQTCGKLNIDDQPIHGTMKKLAEFGASAGRDELPNWPDQTPPELRGLFLDLSSHAKQQGWINKVDNFPKMLGEIYEDLVPDAPAQKKKAKAAGGGKKPSPLDQMKAKKKAAGSGEGEKKPSPLEQMKAKAAAKKKAAEGGGEEKKDEGKKLSPIEQIKAKQAAKKKAADAGGEESENEKDQKKLSPIEQIRAKQAAKKKAADAGGEESGNEKEEKKLSPIEQIRAKQAAKKKAAETGGEESGNEKEEKKLSPIEQIRAKQAAKKKKKAPEGIPEDAGQTINFSPEQAAQLAAQAEMREPESFNADDVPEGPVVVPCPECEHELKLPDRSLLGRKARCPLCSYKFVLELPEDEEEPEPVGAAAASEGGASPLKQAMMQDAGGNKSAGKASPLQKAREQAAKKKAAKSEGGGGTATAEKPMSPIEKMRAAKKKAAPAGDKKPKKKKTKLKVPKKKKKTFTGPIPRAGELRIFYLRQIRPFLGVDSQYNPRLAVDAQAKRLFNQMRSDLPGELHDTLYQLEESVDERRQFSRLKNVHRWLHWWLYLHIPLSMGLYVLMIAHIVMSLLVDPRLFWG